MDKWCIQYDIMRAFPLLLARAARLRILSIFLYPKNLSKKETQKFYAAAAVLFLP